MPSSTTLSPNELKQFLKDLQEAREAGATVYKQFKEDHKDLIDVILEYEKKLQDSLDRTKNILEQLDEESKATLKNAQEYSKTVRGIVDVLHNIKDIKDPNERQHALDMLALKEKELGNGKAYAEALAKVNKEIKEYNHNVSTQKIDAFKTLVNAPLQVIDSLKTLGNSLLGPWGQADQAASNFAKSMGMSAEAMGRLRKESISFAYSNNIGINYNTSIEELIKLQGRYANALGRNIALSNQQKEVMVATAKVMGDDKAMDFISKLENFGIGMEKAGQLTTKMFKDAAAHGVSFEQYSKVVTDNLTLVQSYGFKNGIEGLTAMARKAVEMKLDMKEVFAFAEKVNSVEGAITTAASLQVLGGPFATAANPMGMLYEGINDMEGLQDRMITMLSRLGEWNAKEGRVDMDGYEMLRVREAAKAMGVSSESLFTSINRQGARNEIERQLGESGRTVDKETLDLLQNVATFNAQGRAVINIGGQEKELTEVNLQDQNILKSLKTDNDIREDSVQYIARTLRGWDDVMQGFKKQTDITKAQGAEVTGIGEMAKSLVANVGKIRELMWAIVAAQTIGSFATAFSSIKGTIYQSRMAANTLGANGPQKVAPLQNTAAAQVNAKNMAVGSTQNVNGVTYTKYNNGWRAPSAKPMSNQAMSNYLNGNAQNIVKPGTNATATTTTPPSGVGKFMASGAGRAATGGAIAGLAAGAIHAMSGDFKKNTTQEDRHNQNKAIGDTVGVAAGAAAGAAIGSVIPGLGTLIGGLIGGAIGRFSGSMVSQGQDRRRERMRNELSEELGWNTTTARAFRSLEGDYSVSELRKIKDALKDNSRIDEGELSKDLLEKIAKSGDAGRFEGLTDVLANAHIETNVDTQNVNAANVYINSDNVSQGRGVERQMATGGIVNGVPHRNGGVPVLGTNITLEGGEFVVPKEATLKHKEILEVISKSPNGGIQPLTVAPTIAPDFTNGMGNSKINHSPINLNVSGTINLSGGGQNVDITSVINNPAFLTSLSQMIENRVTENNFGGNFKELRKNKNHTY